MALLFLAMGACNALADIRDPILDRTLTCESKIRDGDETDVDCGGSCSPCDTGRTCKISVDCMSKICKAQACEPPRCDDGVQNGDETDEDCGGSCSEKCVDGKACLVGDDCTSLVCVNRVCQAPACGDEVIHPSLGEECDDGNSIDDRCGSSCTIHAVTRISCGQAHSCALLNNGKVKCWGDNYNGQLGLGDRFGRGYALMHMGSNLPVVDLGLGRTATAITTGRHHTCALLDDGRVKCWGFNAYGSLGLGDKTARGVGSGEMGENLPAVDLGMAKTAVAITSQYYHTCALLTDGGVKCWGVNGYGQLGFGDTTDRGGNPGEMGDKLPMISLDAGITVAAIAVGGVHSCVLLDDGTVKCWGGNAFGQLGLGDTNSRGDGSGEMGDSLPKIDLGTGNAAKAIAVGFLHTCALLVDGTIKCWGKNEFGQLGLGDTKDRGDNPGEMGDNLPAVDLGAGMTAMGIVAGFDHTCALLSDGTVTCWGKNDGGQLGQGHTNPWGDEPGEMGGNPPTIDLGTGKSATALAAGDMHTCALLDDGSVKCWGLNGDGRLGIGNQDDRGDQPGELGDELPTVKLFSDFW